MSPTLRRLATLLLLSTALSPLAAAAQQADTIQLDADRLSFDERSDIVRAEGRVELVRDPYILRADSVTYDQTSGIVTARGNVALLDDEGNVLFGELMRVSDDLSEAFIEQVRGLFADDSRFAGLRATRSEGRITTIDRAVYSPCDICEGEDPLWQIKARRVTHDSVDKEVRYRDAWLELGGIPVAYTPYFSHPDPSVVRKSGFLTPGIGFDSNLGPFLRSYYYWSVRPDLDFTFEGSITGEYGPLLGLEWRQRFANGEINLLGTITGGEREEGTAGNPSVGDESFRGHIIGGGRFDLSRHWRARFQIEQVTDDNYLRTFDYSEDDVLVTEAVAEGFWDRDYARLRAFTVNDLRPGVIEEQPLVVPDLRFIAYGDPAALFGGRWRLDAGLLALSREPGRDVRRLSLELGWQRRDILPIGLVSTLRARAAGDGYWISDASGERSDEDDLTARFFPQASWEVRYPFARLYGNGTAIIEPVASIEAAPTVIGTVSGIPNEDSTDVELDVTNLFGPTRFPGRDRREDGVRGTLGLRASVQGFGGGYSSLFLGQSYRLVGANPFPEGSGLEDDASDIVGQVQLAPGRWIDLDYRFRIDPEGFEDRLHEVSGSAGTDAFRIFANYLFVRSVAGTGIVDNRNELSVSAESRFADFWRVTASATNRLGAQAGFLRGAMQLVYEDECFLFSANFIRDVTDRLGDDDETSFFLRLSFKNLGEFESPNIIDEILGLTRDER